MEAPQNWEEYKSQSEDVIAKGERLQALMEHPGWNDLIEIYDKWVKGTTHITSATSQKDFMARQKAVEIMGKFWNELGSTRDSGLAAAREIQEAEQTRKTNFNFNEELK